MLLAALKALWEPSQRGYCGKWWADRRCRARGEGGRARIRPTSNACPLTFLDSPHVHSQALSPAASFLATGPALGAVGARRAGSAFTQAQSPPACVHATGATPPPDAILGPCEKTFTNANAAAAAAQRATPERIGCARTRSRMDGMCVCKAASQPAGPTQAPPRRGAHYTWRGAASLLEGGYGLSGGRDSPVLVAQSTLHCLRAGARCFPVHPLV